MSLNPYAQALKKEQDELVVSYMPALRALAFRLKERLPSSIDVNDLISIGVYGAMLDYLRSLDVMSRNNRKIIKDIDTLIDEYYQKYEEEPDDKYLAQRLNLEVEKVKEVRQAHAVSYVLPVDEQVTCYTEDNTLEKIEKQALLDKVSEVLETLKEREQLIIQLYYYEELNLKEISEMLGISESRISQIHKKLLRKLRERVMSA